MAKERQAERLRVVESLAGVSAADWNALAPGEVFRVTEAGELMPQKSTHFYPKLLDGLVLHRLDESVG